MVKRRDAIKSMVLLTGAILTKPWQLLSASIIPRGTITEEKWSLNSLAGNYANKPTDYSGGLVIPGKIESISLSFSRKIKINKHEQKTYNKYKSLAENLRDNYFKEFVKEEQTLDITLDAKDVVFHLNTDDNVMKIVSKGIEWVKDREYIIRYEQLGSGFDLSVADA